MSTIDVGNAGQAFAERFLKGAGYTLVERNWRCRMGEIDIIYRKNDDLIFVEVKALIAHNGAFQPEDHLNFVKQQKLRLLARTYLAYKKLGEIGYQIDVLALDLDKNLNLVDIRHYPNAIEAL